VLGKLRAQQDPITLPGLAETLSNTLASLPIIGQAMRAGGSGSEDGSGPKTNIPGPAPLPSVGSTLDVLRIGGLHKAFQQYEADYGSVFQVQIGSNSTFILVADPDLTRQITMSDFPKFRNRNAPGGDGDGGDAGAIVGERKGDDDTAQTASPTASLAEDEKAAANVKEDSDGVDAINNILNSDSGGVGVVAATDEKWKAMRSSAVSAFGNPKLMSEYSRIVTEETSSLVRRLQPYARTHYQSPQDQPTVDLFLWVRRLTTEVICRIAFSKRLGLVTGKQPEGGKDYQALASALQRFLGNAGRVGRYQPIFKVLQDVSKGTPLEALDLTVPGLTQLNTDTTVMDQYEKAFIAQRRESEASGGDAGTDLLGKMMQTHVSGAKGPLSDLDVQANVREAFVAGSETTGAAISITLHQISSNPRIEWLVRKELKEVLGDSDLASYEHLERLPYLKMCVRETLRLYPSAHVFGRLADDDVEVGGYMIPKGSNVLMSPYYLGRDKTQWGADADVYRPERHLPSDPLSPTRSKFAWMPFGAGPRMCLGAALAMIEATVTVAGVLQNYKVTPLSKTIKYDYLITIELEEGIPVRLTPLRDAPEVQEGPEWVVQAPKKAPKSNPKPQPAPVS